MVEGVNFLGPKDDVLIRTLNQTVGDHGPGPWFPKFRACELGIPVRADRLSPQVESRLWRGRPSRRQHLSVFLNLENLHKRQ